MCKLQFIIAVVWVSVLCASSSQCHGLVFDLWLWHLLAISRFYHLYDRGGSARISGNGVQMYKGVGDSLLLILWFFLNIPWKWNNLVSVRPNYFIFTGYLKRWAGSLGSSERSWWTPLDPPLYEVERAGCFNFIYVCLCLSEFWQRLI